MICIQLNGGLGNQMFQYACGRNLAHKHKTELAFDTSYLKIIENRSGFTSRSFALDVFEIPKNEINSEAVRKYKPFLYRILNVLLLKMGGRPIQTKKFFVENEFSYNDAIEKTGPDCFLSGYWQSPLYFQDISSIIQNEFQFKKELNQENKRWIEKIAVVNAVSLHIRRTDFVSNKSHDIHGTCSMEYYKSAVEYIASKVMSPVFFVFSDDIKWASENLEIPYGCHFISGNEGSKSYIDMQLMSQCRHHIIANSSFSWWGAWLNNKQNKLVVAPNQWFLDNKLNAQTKDLIPQSWIRI